jgi:hypothetical protein
MKIMPPSSGLKINPKDYTAQQPKNLINPRCYDNRKPYIKELIFSLVNTPETNPKLVWECLKFLLK